MNDLHRKSWSRALAIQRPMLLPPPLLAFAITVVVATAAAIAVGVVFSSMVVPPNSVASKALA